MGNPTISLCFHKSSERAKKGNLSLEQSLSRTPHLSCRGENCGTDRLSELPKNTQLVSDELELNLDLSGFDYFRGLLLLFQKKEHR